MRLQQKESALTLAARIGNVEMATVLLECMNVCVATFYPNADVAVQTKRMFPMSVMLVVRR